jgi:hypothetical protein
VVLDADREWRKFRSDKLKQMYRIAGHATLYFCLTAPAAALEHGPHVHGTGELQVAVDSNTLTLELHAPLENLLGFEHAARTASEREAVKAMTAKLERPEMLFKLPKAASCTARPTRIESPITAASATGARMDPKKNAGGDHADLSAPFSFICTRIDKLDSIEVAIFTAFPATRTLNAAVIGPRGQSAATLTPNRRVIRF